MAKRTKPEEEEDGMDLTTDGKEELKGKLYGPSRNGHRHTIPTKRMHQNIPEQISQKSPSHIPKQFGHTVELGGGLCWCRKTLLADSSDGRGLVWRIEAESGIISHPVCVEITLLRIGKIFAFSSRQILV